MMRNNFLNPVLNLSDGERAILALVYCPSRERCELTCGKRLLSHHPIAWGEGQNEGRISMIGG